MGTLGCEAMCGSEEYQVDWGSGKDRSSLLTGDMDDR